MLLKKFLYVTAFCLASLAANAAVGCKSNGSNWLYSAYTGMVQGYPIYEKTPRVDFDDVYCEAATGTTCYIRTTSYSECQGCPYINPYYYQIGTQYSYSTVDCPIDDYAGLMVATVAGLGLFYLRKGGRAVSFS